MLIDSRENAIKQTRIRINELIDKIEIVKTDCVNEQFFAAAHYLREATLSLRNLSRDLFHSSATTTETTDSKEVAR